MAHIVYHAEIASLIPSPGERKLPGYRYCSGQQDFKNMGVSCICAADLFSDKTWVFSSKEELGESIKNAGILLDTSHSKIYGFNSVLFDDVLLDFNGISTKTLFDLLIECRISAHGTADWWKIPEGFSYKLQYVAEANGLTKTGTSELAPKLWQDGKYLEVIDHCLNDVMVTKELILLFLENKLINPNTGEYFE